MDPTHTSLPKSKPIENSDNTHTHAYHSSTIIFININKRKWKGISNRFINSSPKWRLLKKNSFLLPLPWTFQATHLYAAKKKQALINSKLSIYRLPTSAPSPPKKNLFKILKNLFCLQWCPWQNVVWPLGLVWQSKQTVNHSWYFLTIPYRY